MITIILAWLQATGLTLEWTAGDGRTFQFSGHHGMVGCWERFFHSRQHPTRRAVSEKEAAKVWAAAVEPLLLYSVFKDEEGAERLTREQILDRVEDMFPGSVRRA